MQAAGIWYTFVLPKSSPTARASSLVSYYLVQHVRQLIKLTVQIHSGFGEIVSIREELFRDGQTCDDRRRYVFLLWMRLSKRPHLTIEVIGDVFREILFVLCDPKSVFAPENSDADRFLQLFFDLTGHISRSLVVEVLVDRSDEAPHPLSQISRVPVVLKARLRLHFLDRCLQLSDTLGHAGVFRAKPDDFVRGRLDALTKSLQRFDFAKSRHIARTAVLGGLTGRAALVLG